MTGSLLDESLSGDPGRPFVTYYDDRTGERVELSVTTLANWVAKTSGLLVDGLGVDRGDRLRLDLPRHWQRPVWALAAWQVGLVVDLVGDPAECRVAVCGPEGIDAALAAEDVVAVSLRPLGAPFAPGALPSHVLDYAREVGGYADHFSGPGVDDASEAIRAQNVALTLAAARAEAVRLTTTWQLDRRGRLHVREPLDPLTELLATTLVPLAVDGSVVLTQPSDATDSLATRTASERVTAEAHLPS